MTSEWISRNKSKFVMWETRFESSDDSAWYDGIPFIVLGRDIYECHCNRSPKETLQEENVSNI